MLKKIYLKYLYTQKIIEVKTYPRPNAIYSHFINYTCTYILRNDCPEIKKKKRQKWLQATDKIWPVIKNRIH